MYTNNSNRFFIVLLMITHLILSSYVHAALAPAGTLIKNQASATYKDAAGVMQFATSNVVETLIQQVGALSLTNDQAKQGVPTKTVYFPHVITNTGNGADTYTLSATNGVGDDFDFDSIEIFADEDRDGQADSITPITVTPNIAAEKEFYVIVAAKLPAANDGETGTLTLTATSNFDNSVNDPADPGPTYDSQSNTDTVTASDKAVVDVIKSMSLTGGASPSGNYTVTLAYKNSGLQPASNVELIDALPTGMSYVANSATWSIEESLVLTDSDPADTQGTGDTITFCAYDATCIGLTEAASDTDTDSVNQVTAIVASVPSGGKGELTFEVLIDADVESGNLYNTGEFAYNDSANPIALTNTNTVPFEVQSALGVSANGSDSDSTNNLDNQGGTTDSIIVDTAQQGEIVFFENQIWNTSNTEDTIEIELDEAAMTFPAGTQFLLFNSDGATPLMDTNADGRPDTGPMDAGAVEKIVVRAILPQDYSGDNSGAGFDITLTASSAQDTSVSDTVVDHIGEIEPAAVDLMNDETTLGAGIGPETAPVNTYAVNPGESASIPLYVNNKSGTADSYLLEYSIDDPFAKGTLPTGWDVQFFLFGSSNDCSTLGIALTSSSVIPANSSRLICAVVTIPEDAPAQMTPQSLYFKVSSPITGAMDIKHDAIQVGTAAGLSIAPNQNSQTDPGTPVVFKHVVNNEGNTALECLNIAAVNTQSDWSVIVYHDANDNEQLDSTDPQIKDIDLAMGGTETVFVKVFPPASAALGTTNTTTLTATAQVDDAVAGCSGATQTATIADEITLSDSFLAIYKEQAHDADCDGVVADTDFGASLFQVSPGECVVYRLTSENKSAKIAKNVRIDDASPEYTTFHHAGDLPKTNLGNIVGGADGDDGVINAGSVGGATVDLQPGESLEVLFGVKLD